MAMAMATAGRAGSGLALGAWGAAQATAAGLAIFAGGVIRDTVNHWAAAGLLGPALAGPSTGYSVVYHIEIALVFITLAALGRLVRTGPTLPACPPASAARFGLAELPS
jgi:BCD family chlorophyll transporter-like MFS transporter